MKESLSVFTITVNAKDEAGVKVLEELFNKFVQPFVQELPFAKNIQKITKGEYLTPLLELGLNVSDFHNFKDSFKSEFIP